MRRLTSATLKKLEALEAPRTVRTGGVLLVPAILDAVTWERQARAYYDSRDKAEAEDRRISDDLHLARTALPVITAPSFQPGTYAKTTRS